ncbi:MAG: response regulator transcription factor [Dehalococcoidia bacterium]
MVADSDLQAGAPAVAGGYAVGVLSVTGQPASELLRCLEAEGVSVSPLDWNAPGAGVGGLDVLILDLTEADRRTTEAFAGRANASPPSIAAISWEHLRGPDLAVPGDDVVVVPWRPGELNLRIRRLVDRKAPPDQPGVIRAGDLVINPDRYDVFLAGKPVLLTFKEYELLKLLAANPGRVYSREALLEQVWGYKYFGGTRTVDVHVRRLRSKIDDATHTFIDTVWNVGYRFHG